MLDSDGFFDKIGLDQMPSGFGPQVLAKIQNFKLTLAKTPSLKTIFAGLKIWLDRKEGILESGTAVQQDVTFYILQVQL